MIQGSLSRRYAKALFQLALEQRGEEETGQEMERFLSTYTTTPLAAVLDNPAFDAKTRKKIVAQVSEALGLSSLVIHFLSLLVERQRLRFLFSIASFYRRFLDEAKGRVEAKVVSPRSLEETILKRLREVLHAISGKEVVLHQETDPELLGGAVIHLEGKIYDGSVRTQLEKMRERMERGY